MTDDELLPLLRIDLGIMGTAYDPQLSHLLKTAKELITREGITLSDSAEDVQLMIMYAAYLYRKRATQEGMPRMLRWALNNRLFGGGPHVAR